MQPISAISPALPQQAAQGVRTQEASRANGNAGEARERTAPAHPMDEYVRGETPEPSGRYWPARDADGRPAACFDSPERADAAPAAEQERASSDPDKPDETAGPAKQEEPEGGTKRCAVSTDRVDREIEALKKQKAELEKQLRAASDDAEAKALQTRLDRIERELTQKDNDAYRREHAEYTVL